jgi:polyisoprenyl-phosphate glycosyltransferase
MSSDRSGRVCALMTVVAPVYNEEKTVRAFYERVTQALRDVPFELVLVDDGSTDLTPEIVADIASRDHRVKVVSLSRNFGHQAALTAGLDHATGDPVVMLDADLQDPPEVIPEMVEQWRRGMDVVYAIRTERAGETPFKLRTASWFYRLFSFLADIKLEQNAGDFRLLSRRALDALLQMRERHRFLRGMTIWIGFAQTALYYKRDPRYAGETKYTLRKMLRFGLDGVSSFSNAPLQLAMLLGFLVSAFAFLAIPVVVGLRLAGHYLPGFGTITIAVLLLGGIQLMAIGIIGEYIGRVYDEVKRRPLYLVRDVRNAETPSLPEERDLHRTA